MRVGEVIGRVTLSRAHPSLKGSRFLVVTSLNVAGLQGDAAGRGEPFVVYDQLGAGMQHLVGISEGAEAAAPFLPDIMPIDGYIAAILDRVET